MRLIKIKIKEYRVLKDFSLEFHEESNGRAYTLHLIVGLNGTGKSTLLRLLAKLFLQLSTNENNRNPAFGFEVSYQLKTHGEIISLTNLDDDENVLYGNSSLRIAHGQEGTLEADSYRPFESGQDSDVFPPLIVILTTGSEKEWLDDLQEEDQAEESAEDDLSFPDPQESTFQEDLATWYLQELPGSLPDDETPETIAEDDGAIDKYTCFVTNAQIPLVVLCGMLVDMLNALQHPEAATGQDRNFQTWMHLHAVMKEARIAALQGFSLRFRINKDTLVRPDEILIEELRKLAHHTIQTGSNYLLVFHLPTNDVARQHFLSDLLTLQGNGFTLFRRLAALTQSQGRDEPLLLQVHLFLQRHFAQSAPEDGLPPLHLFQWLSDGERSFLGRLCLMPLLKDSEALVLLDEPEVHFNDYWKRQLVLMLDASLSAEAETTAQRTFQPCHVIMTTHSSITLTDVLNRNIVVLRRQNSHTGKPSGPPSETLGADPSDLMVSVFGAEYATGARGTHYIDQQVNTILHSGQTKDDQQRALRTLLDDIGPGYWRFFVRRKLHELEGRR